MSTAARIALALVALWGMGGAMPVAGQGFDNVIVSQPFDAQSHVLELDVPPGLETRYIQFAWQRADGEIGTAARTAKVGRHLYDLRSEPRWRGPITAVATRARLVTGRLHVPTLGDEVAMFLSPEGLNPYTVNLRLGYTFFGWPWSRVLLVLFAVVAACLWACLWACSWAGMWAGSWTTMRRAPAVALVAAFLVVWSLEDLRNVWEHAHIVRARGPVTEALPPFTATGRFADGAEPMIGARSWGSEASFEPLVVPYVIYRLLDHRLTRVTDEPPPDVLVTRAPGDRSALFASDGLALVERTPP